MIGYRHTSASLRSLIGIPIVDVMAGWLSGEQADRAFEALVKFRGGEVARRPELARQRSG